MSYKNFNDVLEPLAYLIRPESLDEFFGQEDVVGEGSALRHVIESDSLHSLIFYGPPGTGKTTLAFIISRMTKARFKVLSAVTSGVADIRKVAEEAMEYKRLGNKTVLFVDEVHRFSKSQQDALLPYTEDGTLILIGATTENPSFEVNNALLSRSQVFVFHSLSEGELKKVVLRAVSEVAKRFGIEFVFDDDALGLLIEFANGDARNLLNLIEIVFKVKGGGGKIVKDDVVNILQKKSLRYDKNGEEHYNLISALHKSLRDSDPDAGIYWMERMLSAGEDPKYIVRRLIRFASEDIGMADPHALLVAVATKDACLFVGLPECAVNLAHLVVYLALAPKSNAVYKAHNQVVADIKKFGNLDVPLHIRNASTKLMKDMGYGKGYKYAHDFEGAKVEQTHLPDVIKDKKYYFPTDRGIEGRIKRNNSKL